MNNYYFSIRNYIAKPNDPCESFTFESSSLPFSLTSVNISSPPSTESIVYDMGKSR